MAQVRVAKNCLVMMMVPVEMATTHLAVAVKVVRAEVLVALVMMAV